MDEEEDFQLSDQELMFRFLEEGDQNQTLNEEDISLVH